MELGIGAESRLKPKRQAGITDGGSERARQSQKGWKYGLEGNQGNGQSQSGTGTGTSQRQNQSTQARKP